MLSLYLGVFFIGNTLGSVTYKSYWYTNKSTEFPVRIINIWLYTPYIPRAAKVTTATNKIIHRNTFQAYTCSSRQSGYSLAKRISKTSTRHVLVGYTHDSFICEGRRQCFPIGAHTILLTRITEVIKVSIHTEVVRKVVKHVRFRSKAGTAVSKLYALVDRAQLFSTTRTYIVPIIF